MKALTCGYTKYVNLKSFMVYGITVKEPSQLVFASVISHNNDDWIDELNLNNIFDIYFFILWLIKGFYKFLYVVALSRHSNNTAIDNQVCLFWWLFDDPVKPWNKKQTLWGHWEALIGWHGVPNCSKHLPRLVVWWSFLWPTECTTWPVVSTGRQCKKNYL